MTKPSKRSDLFINGRTYEKIRKDFIDNHPMKCEEIRNKVSDSLLTYYKSDEYIEKEVLRKREIFISKAKECACGCGELTTGKYINREHALKHRRNDKSIDKETGKKVGISIKKYLVSLTESEMNDRMKSCHSLTEEQHRKRGEAISKGKKGKSTNQKKVEEKKYGEMTEEQFDEYTKNRKPFIIKRMTKRRIDYLNGINAQSV